MDKAKNRLYKTKKPIANIILTDERQNVFPLG